MKLNTAEEILQALNNGLELSCLYRGAVRSRADRYFRIEHGKIIVRDDAGMRRNSCTPTLHYIYEILQLYNGFEVNSRNAIPFKRLPV